MKDSSIKKWLFALALSTPLVLFFLGYLFNHHQGLIPTGFIQYDNASYIAYARQYLDADTFHLQYANPFHDGPSTPVYFQPQTLLFAGLLKLGISPGGILIPFTFLCSVLCFYLVISLYDLLVAPGRFRIFHIWLFAWGGGLLVLASPLAHFYLNSPNSLAADLFILDPESGWWGLNLGRALIFSCEAYYHLLFLGCIYALLKKKWAGALVLIFLLSLSHPFTGTELIAIIGSWCLIEFLFAKTEMPYWFLLGLVFIFCFHLYYYFFYLNRFSDHRSVSEQYSLPWRLGWYRALPAYCLVIAFALVSVLTASLKKFFQIRSNRLFACWFVVAFLLANHEYFIKARQPIHFTRGYIWTSLFLLGLPALQYCTNWLQNKMGRLGLFVLGFVFFLDNLAWIGLHLPKQEEQPDARYLSAEQKKFFGLLDAETRNRTLIIGSDETIAYLSAVYTRGWPWYSHPYTTPFAWRKKKAQDLFFSRGVTDSAWQGREVNFVLRKTDSLAFHKLLTIPPEKIIKTNQYIIFKYPSFKE